LPGAGTVHHITSGLLRCKKTLEEKKSNISTRAHGTIVPVAAPALLKFEYLDH